MFKHSAEPAFLVIVLGIMLFMTLDSSNQQELITQQQAEIVVLQNKIVVLQEELDQLNTDNLPVLQNFEVTWYNYSGITKSGRPTVSGVTAAVDPSVIALGTWMEITLPNGEKMIRRADDTGGAVRGNVVDIYSNESTKTLLQWGRVCGATVRILG